MQPETVFVIDDHDRTRSAVAALAKSVGAETREFRSVEDFLAVFTRSDRRCIVTDVRLPGMSGTELQEALLEIGSRLPLIVLSGYANTRLVADMILKGATTFFDKPFCNSELCASISQALEADVKRHEQEQLVASQHEKLQRLDENENAVLELLLQGHANKKVATRLKVSIRTIENRRAAIFKKTETQSLVEVATLVLDVKSLLQHQQRLAEPVDAHLRHNLPARVPQTVGESNTNTRSIRASEAKRCG